MALLRSEIIDLLNGEEIAFIATTRINGQPHLVPIWFIYHNDRIYINTERTSVKFKNLEKNNKLSLCFGGKETYIVEGSMKWYSFEEAPVDMKRLLWEKYPNEMREKYITPKSIVMEIVPEKELSWHYIK